MPWRVRAQRSDGVRITPVMRTVMRVILAAPPGEPVWGLPICDRAGIGTGRVYPALDRLMKAGWITDRWEDPAPAGRPRRRFYERAVAVAQVERMRGKRLVAAGAVVLFPVRPALPRVDDDDRPVVAGLHPGVTEPDDRRESEQGQEKRAAVLLVTVTKREIIQTHRALSVTRAALSATVYEETRSARRTGGQPMRAHQLLPGR